LKIEYLWFRSAQSFKNDKLPSFDIRFIQFLLLIKLAASQASGRADT